MSSPTLTGPLVPRSTTKFNNDFDNTAACGDDAFTLFLFCPSEYAALAVCALFGLATLLHMILALVHRRWFCLVVIIGTGFECLGYAVRAYSTQHQQSITYYSAWYITLLVTPLIINAWVYMILGRMVDFFVPERTVGGVYAKRVTLIFVLADIFTFIVQLGGGSLLTVQNNPGLNQTGSDVFMVGMGMQQASLAVFGLLVYLMHRRLRVLGDPRPGHPWLPYTLSLYAALFLISLRTIYKIVEFAGGATGPLLKIEWPWYAFDSAPIFLAVLILAIWHPGRVLKGPGAEYKKIPKHQRKELIRQYKVSKSMHRPGYDSDGAELGLMPGSGGADLKPTVPHQFAPVPTYENDYRSGGPPRTANDPMRGAC